MRTDWKSTRPSRVALQAGSHRLLAVLEGAIGAAAAGAALAIPAAHRLHVDRAHLAGIEVDGAGESHVLFGRIAPAQHVDHADHPIVAAGVVVDARVAEFDCASAEARARLLPHGILADADGLFGGEAAGPPPG